MPRGRKKKLESSGSVDAAAKLKSTVFVDYGDDLPKSIYVDDNFDYRKLGLYEFGIMGTFFVDGKSVNRVLLLKKK